MGVIGMLGIVVSARFEASEGPQRALDVAGHHYLVVEDAPDHPVAVDDVGHPGGAQPETALDVVEPAYLSRGVAAEAERGAGGVAEAPEPVYAVSADADDDGVEWM